VQHGKITIRQKAQTVVQYSGSYVIFLTSLHTFVGQSHSVSTP